MKKMNFGAAKQGLIWATVALGFGMMTACSSVNVDTPEGLLEAVQKREKLDKAMPKLYTLSTQANKIAPFIPELIKLYQEGSAFDRDVITILATAGVEAAIPAYEKAAKSRDYKQVIQAAYGAKASKSSAVQKVLLDGYDAQINPEVKRVIIDTGTAIKNELISQKALSVLQGNLDDTPFALLRASCRTLEFQRDPSTAETLVVAIFHMDGVGRSLSADCTAALLALGKEVAGPVLLNAYELKNKALQEHVSKNPDTLTDDTVRNNTAHSLALLRYTEALPAMLNFVGDTKVINVPGTLAIRPAGDPAWSMWAGLVGTASQTSIFAINDLGVKGNAQAKEIFKKIFYWDESFKKKFQNPIQLSNSTNIEVSQRVNAFRVLRENDLIAKDEMQAYIDVLKGEEFEDLKTYRNYARASIATDMLTYLAVTSRAGDTRGIWQVFSDMKEKEFLVPVPEDPEAPKVAHPNDGIVERIENVKAAFLLADQCDTNTSCYAQALEKENLSNYERIKIVYELGLSGKEEYFETVASIYKTFDNFGQIYATRALANLGSAKDLPRIEELLKSSAREMSQLAYTSAKPNLEGLLVTLANK